MSKAQRFVLLPPRGTGAAVVFPSAADTLRLFNPQGAGDHTRALRSALGVSSNVGANLKVVDSIHEHAAKLVEMTPEAASALRAAAPGLRIVPEVFHYPLRAPRPTIEDRFTAKTRAATLGIKVTITIGSGAGAKPAVGATVVAFTNFAARQGAQGVTSAKGVVTLKLPDGIKIEQLYVYPEFGAWSLFKKNLTLKNGATLAVAPLDLQFSDGLSVLMGRGQPNDGHGVTVGIIDTGVGPHHDIPVAGGENTVTGEKPADFQDNGEGHGTHVGGIVGARGGANGLTGIAPGATIRSYRVFGAKAKGASNFAIAKAIVRATEQGCDLLNMSLGGGPADEATQAAIADARAAGVLVMVATGNDGRQPVSFPARFGMSVAVSACGRKGTFPPGTTETADIAPPFGTDKKNFIAAFSNIGPEVDITGAGVGIISTFPNNRYCVMSGTSMACPAVTGVAARLLAANPDILAMPRNQDRSDRIAKLLFSAAKSLGFPAEMQGVGLPR